MHKHPSKGRGGKWAALVLIALVVGAVAYLARQGSTDSWPETDCVIVGNRVIRSDFSDGTGNGSVMWKGQYQLRYTISGHDYFVWANAGWFDPEREFVQRKVEYLPEHCDFRVRYNPLRPKESVAIRKSE